MKLFIIITIAALITSCSNVELVPVDKRDGVGVVVTQDF